jgi:uncharacterized repeat protein (TIGR03803 family)
MSMIQSRLRIDFCLLGLVPMVALCLAGTAASHAQITDLASFNGPSGNYPTGSLTLIGSTLYGTTSQGGANDDGTVFSVPTPEPGSATLLTLGVTELCLCRRHTMMVSATR